MKNCSIADRKENKLRSGAIARLSCGCALILLLAVSAMAQLQTVVVGPTSSGQASGVDRLTFSHTTGSGNDRLLLVSVSVGPGWSGVVSVADVTYAGLSLMLVGSEAYSIGGKDIFRSHIYQLVNPPAGTASVVVKLSGAGTVTAGATTFSGVDQSQPLGAVSTGTGAGKEVSVTVASAAGEVVYGTASVEGPPSLSLPDDSGQTLAWSHRGGSLWGAASTEPGAASVTHSYSMKGSRPWTSVVASVRPGIYDGYAVWANGIEWNGAASGPDDDPDGDGMTNYEEYLAGTDPLDADSKLKITSIRKVANGLEIGWPSVSGRRYRVEYASNLKGPWFPVAPEESATPPRNRFVRPGEDQGYFRIVLKGTPEL